MELHFTIELKPPFHVYALIVQQIGANKTLKSIPTTLCCSEVDQQSSFRLYFMNCYGNHNWIKTSRNVLWYHDWEINFIIQFIRFTHPRQLNQAEKKLWAANARFFFSVGESAIKYRKGVCPQTHWSSVANIAVNFKEMREKKKSK